MVGVRLVRSGGGGGVEITCTTSPTGDVLLLDVLGLSRWCMVSGRFPMLRGEHVRQSDGLPTQFSEGRHRPVIGLRVGLLTWRSRCALLHSFPLQAC